MIIYKTERDQGDIGSFVFVFDTDKKNLSDKPLCIAHLHVPDEEIGCDYWNIGDIWVHQQYRRQGIASKMMEIMSKLLGSSCRGAASVFSTDGEAFFDAYRSKAY